MASGEKKMGSGDESELGLAKSSLLLILVNRFLPKPALSQSKGSK